MATQSVKDILNTEVPKPSFALSPSVPAPLPSGVTVTRNGQDNVARTLDPYSGKFEHVPEDTARVYGSDQGLLVEAAGRTNQIPKSSQISKANWDGSFDIASETKVDSILEEKNAYKITGAGSSSANVNKQNVGTFTGGTETVEFIIEKGTSGKVGGEVRNSDTGNSVVGFRYDWGTDTLTVASGSAQRMNTRRTAGPNGNPLVFLTVSYSGGNAENTLGDTRRVFANVDPSASASSSIWHHAQLEEAPNASSPIVTSSSAKTRAGDDYTIPVGDWWNNTEMTLLIELTPLAYNYPNFNWIIGNDNNNRIDLRGRPPFDVNLAGGPSIGVSGIGGTFELHKIGISMGASKTTLSVNGLSNSASQEWTGFLNESSELVWNTGKPMIGAYNKITAIPRALPESTLNVLTS